MKLLVERALCDKKGSFDVFLRNDCFSKIFSFACPRQEFSSKQYRHASRRLRDAWIRRQEELLRGAEQQLSRDHPRVRHLKQNLRTGAPSVLSFGEALAIAKVPS